MKRTMILATLLLMGCDSIMGGDDSTSGTWTGQLPIGDQSYAVSMEISENGEREIIGGATFGSVSVLVDGTRTGSSVALTMTPFSEDQFTYLARIDGDRMAGKLTGSGFTGDELTLKRR